MQLGVKINILSFQDKNTETNSIKNTSKYYFFMNKIHQ